MKGEDKAESPTLGEVAEIERKQKMGEEQNNAVLRRTLKIWDVPSELASKFISVARGSYGNKSWLYLQDLMRKADLFDQLISSGRIEDHERRLNNLEEFAKRMNDLVIEAQDEPVEEKAKVPKTFGGD